MVRSVFVCIFVAFVERNGRGYRVAKTPKTKTRTSLVAIPLCKFRYQPSDALSHAETNFRDIATLWTLKYTMNTKSFDALLRRLTDA